MKTPCFEMGEVAASTPGLLPQLCSLLDNNKFSDVEFLFESEEGQSQKMYGHKLILALRSEYFASLFYKGEEKVHQVEIPASKRWPFYLMLKFLYTDVVQFCAVKEAQDLYALAEQYCVKELADKCLEYLLQEKITIENVLPKYECALSKKVEKLLNDCRDFVCCETKSVLKSANFSEASVAVIEDILTQDKLSVPTELEVIFAVMQWAKAECIRRNMSSDDKKLRQCIEPFLKHLRFLSLTHVEFRSFLQQYDIFSGYESNLITQKLFIPNSEINIPENICCVDIKRGPIISRGENYLDVDLLSNFEKYTMPLKPQPVGIQQKSQDQDDLQNNAAPRQSNKIAYQIKRVTPLIENRSHLQSTKFCPSPKVLDNPFPAKNIPLIPSRCDQRYFTFPLSKNPQGLRYCFPRDITCSATFKMKSGSIKLLGFELSIKNNQKSVPEELKVGVTLSGFGRPSSELYRKELNKDTLTVMFNNPAILKENCKGELTVNIDELILNRCSTCSNHNQLCEINNGLNFVCKISINSNCKLQNNDGIVVLMSKLIYTTAK